MEMGRGGGLSKEGFSARAVHELSSHTQRSREGMLPSTESGEGPQRDLVEICVSNTSGHTRLLSESCSEVIKAWLASSSDSRARGLLLEFVGESGAFP